MRRAGDEAKVPLAEANHKEVGQALLGEMPEEVRACPSCHEVKHMGFSELRDKNDEAVAHQALVSGWSLQGAFEYVDEAFEVWRQRSRHAWQLDILWLGTQGIKLQDETAPAGDFIPETNQLSLMLEVQPVATKSTTVPAPVEHERTFLQCDANPEGQACISIIVGMGNVLDSLPEGVLSIEKGDSGAMVIRGNAFYAAVRLKHIQNELDELSRKNFEL